MSISFLDRLNQIFELLAAKRTPEQEAEDRLLQKKLLEKKAAKDQKRREKTGQKPLQYRKEAKQKAKKQEDVVTKQEDAKSIVEKIKVMTDPKILLVSSTNMDMEGGTEDDAKAGHAEFKKSEKIKSIFGNCVNLTNVDGIHSWIGSSKDIDLLMGEALYSGLAHAIEVLPDDLLEKEDPFKELVFGKMKGVEKKESKIRLDLNEAWKPVFEYLTKNQEEQPEDQPESEPESESPSDEADKKDKKDEDKKTPIIQAFNNCKTIAELAEVWKKNSAIYLTLNADDKHEVCIAVAIQLVELVKAEDPKDFGKRIDEALDEFGKASGIKEEDNKELEKSVDEIKGEEEEESDDDFDTGNAPKVNVGKFRSLKNPYIFLLDPRKRYQDYLNFLRPDEKDAKVKKASQVLTRSSVIKFLVSKKVKSQELAPVIVYFLSGKDAADLKVELKRESRPHFILSAVDKAMFDKDEPFSDLKLGDIAVDKLLVDEMNRIWIDATSQASGNPIPAVQANTQVPLDYFRLLNKKHRPIQVYIGNQPEGAGSENTIYVLATEQEAT